ncbi:MAG: HAD-IIB family hydrolase [Methanophagales archaeon]|nr:HAD-IIB family hydrolase [Methanophagales archaeon]
MKEVLITDLDGTLLDIADYSYDAVLPALESLKERDIPVIFCTAKTLAENEYYREIFGLVDPFIVDNGGAIFIPKNYFSFEFESVDRDNYYVIELGASYTELRAALKAIREETGFKITGFGDMSAEEVAKDANLSIDAAIRAKKKEYNESFILDEPDAEEKEAILFAKIEEKGFSVTHGGRYYNIHGKNADKGKAVEILTRLFEKEYGAGAVKTLGIGDSRNDIPMLNVVDQPAVVKNKKGKWLDISLSNLYKTTGVGPEGWVEFVEKFISDKVAKDTVYLVPHTHYDAIWVFTKEDYFHINLVLILKEVVELVAKTDYKFLIEQTFLLDEMEKRYPELFLKVARYIKEGKIEIAGGEYLMADTMLPTGETLIREILVGKRYVKEKFGVDVPVMWQADSFGMNAQLPQIYKKLGYKYVAFRRGVPERSPSEFIWHGLDGTKILTHWMPLGYRAGLDLDLTKLDDSYNKLKEVAATSHILMPSGSGVTQAQSETPEVVRAWNEKKEEVAEMKIATPSEFFDAVEKEIDEKNLEMAVRNGEMYSGKYSEVFPNCCSSRMWIKKGLCSFENCLLDCECWSTIISLLDGNPSEVLMDCWRKILFIAFHDAVPGTGTDEVYDEVRQYLNFLKIELSALRPRVHNQIIEHESEVELGGESGDIIVFNTLSWEVNNWIEMDLDFDKGEVVTVKGLKSGGTEINVEVIRFARYDDDSLRYARIGFTPTVPGLGYRVYKILEREPKRYRYDPNYIVIKGNTIENRFFGVEIDPTTGLFDLSLPGKRRKAEREMICTANELVLEEETGDLYYHRQTLGIPLKTEKGEGVKYGSFRVRNFGISKSPLRRVITIETDYYSLRWPYRLTEKMAPRIWRHKFLECTKKIIVYREIPRIDFITTIINKHPRARLRVRFSTDIKSPDYSCGTQFGVVSRPTDQWNYKPEPEEEWKEAPCGAFPSLKWLDYSDRENGNGLTVIHRGIPENEVRDGNIYLTLLRGVSMLSSDGGAGPTIPVPDAEEFKRYEFRYSVYPHRGTWQEAESYKHAYEFNSDLYAMQLPAGVKLPLKRSFLKIEPKNVILSALKKAENGNKNEVIMRFYETAGEETDAEITLFREPTEVKVVNMLEEEDYEDADGGIVKEFKKEGKRIALTVNPYEIVTLKLKF